MKKILAVLLALSAFVQSGIGQDDIRPAAVGISFFLNDFSTPQKIRSSSLSNVVNNKSWAKASDMSPGIAITYFKGLKKHVDFAGTLAGSFTKYPFPNHQPFQSDRFLLEADASVNLKMFSEKYWVTPYLIAGVGGHMYGKYFGAFVPVGAGFKLNLFDDTHFFIASQYRLPVTAETSNYHFFNQIGIAGRIGKKKEPQMIVPPPPPALDTDKDGVFDPEDKCPTVPGLLKYQGCPVPDTDKDGLNDEEDKCPTVPGVARYQGCPIPDTDKDGINDEEDKCPTVAGLARYQGCPQVDTDGDGVMDEDDKCPTVAGLPENGGCPKLEDYKFDAKKVQFVTGKVALTAAAKSELDKGVAIMNDHPDLKVSIEGHTDNTGDAAYNKSLSEKRAAAVKSYVVSKGISANRLEVVGYGEEKPIADNKTSAGRSKNRRVEFKVLSGR